MRHLLSGPRAKVAAAAIAALLVFAAIVHAQSGGSTIRACVNADGSLRILSDPTGYSNSNQTCSAANQQHALDWNQQGPAGPTGATGATGATGPAGASGTGSDHNFVVAANSGDRKITNHAEQFLVRADCPEGHTVLGGGYSTHGTATLIDQDYVIANAPAYRGSVDSSVGTAGGWYVNLLQSARGPGTAGVTVYAVCTGDPPPGFGAKAKLPKTGVKLARPVSLSPKLRAPRVIKVP
jgi:hypothetical protein